MVLLLRLVAADAMTAVLLLAVFIVIWLVSTPSRLLSFVFLCHFHNDMLFRSDKVTYIRKSFPLLLRSRRYQSGMQDLAECSVTMKHATVQYSHLQVCDSLTL